MKTARRSMTLVLVLIVLATAALLIAPLVAASGNNALRATSALDELRHRVAAESVLALVPALAASREVQAELNRSGLATMSIDLPKLQVQIQIRPDDAKCPLGLLAQLESDEAVRAAIDTLAVQGNLPVLSLSTELQGDRQRRERLLQEGCLESLFEQPTDTALYDTQRACWSEFLTPVGDRVAWRRASQAVLSAITRDLDADLGQRLYAARGDERPLKELMASWQLDARISEALNRRCTSESTRISVDIATRIDERIQHRYVLMSIESDQVLLNLRVHP